MYFYIMFSLQKNFFRVIEDKELNYLMISNKFVDGFSNLKKAVFIIHKTQA